MDIFLMRGKTAAELTSANPLLYARELCVETDTGKWKIGDGTTLWNSLAYSYGAKGDTGDAGATWLSGSVDPTTEGADDDYYLNTTTYDVFKKVSGSWGTAIANIKGVQGESGTMTKEEMEEVLTGEITSHTHAAGAFLSLTDAPAAYTNSAGKALIVKSTEDGLEFGVASSGGSGMFDFGLITESASSAQDWGALA